MPGERLHSYDSSVPLCDLPTDYATVIQAAADLLHVDAQAVMHTVQLFERKLLKARATKGQGFEKRGGARPRTGVRTKRAGTGADSRPSRLRVRT